MPILAFRIINKKQSNLAMAALNVLPTEDLTQFSLGPQKASTQTGPRSIQPFLHTEAV